MTPILCEINDIAVFFWHLNYLIFFCYYIYFRKKMAKIWQKAVNFLNSSDSRVRMETQQISGEDFEEWRCIDICIPKMSKKQKKESSNQRHVSSLSGRTTQKTRQNNQVLRFKRFLKHAKGIF